MTSISSALVSSGIILRLLPVHDEAGLIIQLRDATGGIEVSGK
jgi:hypothetical protein